MPARIPVDETLFRRLHAQKLTDGEIAERMGLAQRTVAKRRVEWGLPHNFTGPRAQDAARQGGRPAMSIDEEQLRSLHAQGLPNSRIAEQMGIHHDAIGDAMRRLGLESNYRNRPTRVDSPAPDTRHPTPPKPPKPAKLYTVKPAGQTSAAKLRSWRIGIIQSTWRRVVARQMEATR